MKRAWLAVLLVALAGCAEGDTQGNSTSDTDVRPQVDVGFPDVCAPVAESCDGIDNDCDGTIDEDCDCVHGEEAKCKTLEPTLDGIGACRAGTQICEFGVWSACDGEVLPSDEVCDGVDNDCDRDVDEDFGNETCGEGACQVTVALCQNGQPQTCTPGAPNAVERCDGMDDNCNGTVDEGCACITGRTQACYTGAANTRGKGICADGVQTCDDAGQWGPCEGEVLPADETCDNTDEDCDGTVDNGNPGGGGTCSTGLAGACDAGSLTCQNGGLVCTQVVFPTAEVCDGLDNDCDPLTADGANDARNGAACDGNDTDLCQEGSLACVDGQIACSDTTGDNVEVCNGMDDDCNPATADGSSDPALGVACDGNDSDLCNEGVNVCTSGALRCNDNTSGTLDLCNGMDDDCDPSSADGSEDPGLGAACDGNDTDLCKEGTQQCVTGALRCSDATGNNVEVCDGVDNDCNPATADGVNDPGRGVACDGADLDLCLEGTMQCSNGAMACNDTTPNTAESCDGLDNDCDGSVDEGFNRNDDPTCAGVVIDLPSISGDSGGDTVTDSWYNEEWLRVRITEDSLSDLYLSATVTLTSAAGTDFDLYVYCESCAGSVRTSVSTGTDVVNVRRNDSWGSNDDFSIYIAVVHKTSSVCGYWNLQVRGNTTVSTETCP